MIKVSSSGIEISSDRYLTDNATGLFFWLNLFILMKLDILSYLNIDSLSGIKTITIGVLLFVLSTAVGLIISVFSYMLLEWLYVQTEKFWMKLKWPLLPIQFVAIYDELVQKYNLSSDNCQSFFVLIEEVLIAQKVNLERFLIQRGIRVLLRNLSFILLLDVILCAIPCTWNAFVQSAVLFLCAIILLFISGYIGFFANV